MCPPFSRRPFRRFRFPFIPHPIAGRAGQFTFTENLMTILRVGTNEKYSDGWAAAFGSKKKATKKKAAKKTAVKATKKKAAKKAAKKSRGKK